jgi:hypothetical protein
MFSLLKDHVAALLSNVVIAAKYRGSSLIQPQRDGWLGIEIQPQGSNLLNAKCQPRALAQAGQALRDTLAERTRARGLRSLIHALFYERAPFQKVDRRVFLFGLLLARSLTLGHGRVFLLGSGIGRHC